MLYPLGSKILFRGKEYYILSYYYDGPCIESKYFLAEGPNKIGIQVDENQLKYHSKKLADPEYVEIDGLEVLGRPTVVVGDLLVGCKQAGEYDNVRLDGR